VALSTIKPNQIQLFNVTAIACLVLISVSFDLSSEKLEKKRLSIMDFSFLPATNKTDRHEITEILLKVALSTIKPNQIQLFNLYFIVHVFELYIN
jgi:hypothetical protein